jgi:hypothetical protein
MTNSYGIEGENYGEQNTALLEEVTSSLLSGEMKQTDIHSKVDQASLFSFITQVFDHLIDEIQPKAVKDCLETIKLSYEALL